MSNTPQQAGLPPANGVQPTRAGTGDDKKRKKRSVIARILAFVVMVAGIAVICGGLFVTYAIGAAMSAGSGGGNGVFWIGLLFVAGVCISAYFAFGKE